MAIPGSIGSVLQPGTPANEPGFLDGFRKWMSSPENRAALLQTSLALMQPISPGQSPIGQIGQAIGQGAEARTRRSELSTKEKAAAREEETKAAELARDTERLALDKRRVDLEAANTRSLVGSRGTQDKLALQTLKGEQSNLSAANKAFLEETGPFSPLATATPEEKAARLRVIDLLYGVDRKLGATNPPSNAKAFSSGQLESIRQEVTEAIAQGKPPHKLRQRLIERGIDPKSVGL